MEVAQRFELLTLIALRAGGEGFALYILTCYLPLPPHLLLLEVI